MNTHQAKRVTGCVGKVCTKILNRSARFSDKSGKQLDIPDKRSWVSSTLTTEQAGSTEATKFVAIKA